MRLVIKVISIIFLIPLLLLLAWYVSVARPYPIGNYDVLRGAKHASWLPKEATNIYSQNNGAREAYEFSIGENGFLTWAKSLETNVLPIEKEAEIYRYSYFDVGREKPKSTASIAELEEYFDSLEAKSTKGYFEDGIKANGSGYRIMYDKKKQRAFYWWVAW